MAQYIDREAAVKFFLDIAAAGRTSYNIMLLAVARTIAAIPAADVRPVVLCRDCEYFSDVMYGGMQFEYGYCDRWADGTRMNPDDFCSHATKKEES